MPKNNSPFPALVKISRSSLLALLILLLQITLPMVIAEGRAELITFSDYPLGTTITNQYQGSGVIFSGEPQPPTIAPPDYFGIDDPALLGYPLPSPLWGSGSTIATFVNPSDLTPVEAVNVQFILYALIGNAVTFTFYDINGGIISQQELNPGNMYDFQLYFPPQIHKFAITPNSSYVWIDNLSFQLALLIIKQPKVNDVYPLSQESYTKTEDITFEAVRPNSTGRVNWATTLYYATSGDRGQFTLTDSFGSQLNATTTRTYQSKGGRMTVGASSKGETAIPVEYVYIVGVPIPDSEITNRLYSLYRGATPNLLTGIAMKESSYAQFENRTLLGYTGRWPKEDYEGGSHIGLMQVPITMTDAWDWQENTATGAKIYNDKVQAAMRLERRIRNNNPGLRRLTDYERENMGLVLYGPKGSPDLDMQYYIPQEIGNTIDWVVNIANNPEGVSYADSVRALVQ